LASDTLSPRAIVWHYLRDSRYNNGRDEPTDRQADRHMKTAYCAIIASRRKNELALAGSCCCRKRLAYCGLIQMFISSYTICQISELPAGYR